MKEILNLYEINGNNVKEIEDKRIDSWYNSFKHLGLKVYDRETGREFYIPKDNEIAASYIDHSNTNLIFKACYNMKRAKSLNKNTLWSKMKEGDELFVEAADHISRKAIVREVVYVDELRRLVVLDYLIHGDWIKVVFIAPPQGPGVEIPGIGWVGTSTNPKKLVRIHKLKDELSDNLEKMELLEKRNLEIVKELYINGIEI